MGAFNVLHAECRCPVCGQIVEFEAQFKFGDTWQHDYRVGDALNWGGNDIGTRHAHMARVEAICGPCPNCGTDMLEGDMFVRNNRIEGLSVMLGERGETSTDAFQILDD